jgi:hypothetical protein
MLQWRYAPLSGEANYPAGARPSKCIIMIIMIIMIITTCFHDVFVGNIVPSIQIEADIARRHDRLKLNQTFRIDNDAKPPNRHRGGQVLGG